LRNFILFTDFPVPIKSKRQAMNVLPKSGRIRATIVAAGNL